MAREDDDTQTYGIAAAERRQRRRKTSEQIRAVVASPPAPKSAETCPRCEVLRAELERLLREIGR